MARRIALRRVELGAGVAAAALALLTLPVALVAPLYPVCATPTRACAPTAYASLMATHPGPAALAFVVALQIVTLIGAAGAIADARIHPPTQASPLRSLSVVALWVATLCVFAVCALGSRGPIGLLYLPSTLALALAAYVAPLRRVAARRAEAERAHQSEAAQ